jgi:hypothetical protein
MFFFPKEGWDGEKEGKREGLDKRGRGTINRRGRR